MKTVFFDVDTQIDFMFPAGALYVPGAETIVNNIAQLNRIAAQRGILVVSTMDAHAEDDPEFKDWPPHCVVETIGQQKPAATLLDKRVVVKNVADAVDISGAQQILLEKQKLDCFTSVNLAGLLKDWAADRYVVYGVVTEVCVKFAAMGLLATGKRVEIVAEAVRSLDDKCSSDMLREFQAKGGHVTSLSAVTVDVD
jgi:nicotinamidase/pyrazinamidase